MLNQRVNSGASSQEIEEFAESELVDLEFEQEQAPDVPPSDAPGLMDPATGEQLGEQLVAAGHASRLT